MLVKDIASFITENKIKGFLGSDEGQMLYQYAQRAEEFGPCLEIGSYCGKSAIYIASACKKTHNVLFSLDHHQGSEEQQPGEAYFDPSLFDEQRNRIDSFPTFQSAIQLAGLEQAVIPIVSSSQLVCRHWLSPLGMVFVDGGHRPEEAMQDCLNWAAHLGPGGFLAVHDVFPVPEMGGQGPYLAVQELINSGNFVELDTVNSLVVLAKCLP